jgi:hypothetical protein
MACDRAMLFLKMPLCKSCKTVQEDGVYFMMKFICVKCFPIKPDGKGGYVVNKFISN